MGQVEIYPFDAIGRSGQRYPAWIRGLKDQSGVYLIRAIGSTEIAYVGESHSDRLYGTLTRHFQYWSPRYETAGPTYERADCEVAVVLVPKRHALYLQNELICALAPHDNRLTCDPDYAAEQATDQDPPRGYHYDLEAIIEAAYGAHHHSDAISAADVPF